ncbi:MAG: hypothetical protein ACLFUC_00650 [Bacteroidales bacterium]
MKKVNVFKSIGLISALMLISAVISAQPTYVASTVAGEGTDSVTVGSHMPYRVEPDATIAGMTTLMDPSIFKWEFSDGSTVLLEDGSNNATAVAGEPDFFEENAVSVIMGTTIGDITVSATEKSQPKVGAGCEGNTQTMTITVLPRPTIDFNVTEYLDGACSAEDYDIPISLTGYGPWDVTYTISFDGGAPVPYSTTIGSIADRVGTTATDYNLSIPSAQLANGTGEYEVVITNVIDRISNKSLDASLVEAQAADLPSTNSYKLYIYPTPATSPIEHLENVY